jgi:hypothetical protein
MAKYKVPFDPEGNLMHDAEWLCGIPQDEIDWRDPIQFDAMLHIKEYRRGGHAVYYVWENKYLGVTYPMLVSDVFTLLQSADIEGGWVDGRWEIVKRGSAYGIRKVPNDQDD